MIEAKPSWREQADRDYLRKRSQLVDLMREAVETIKKLNKDVDDMAKMLARLDDAAKVFGLSVPGDEFRDTLAPPAAPPPRASASQFRDVALDYLRRAYPNTAKAAEITAWAEKELGRKFHEKTAGMTLYRFSKAGVAERIGHAEWRYIPQKEEGREGSASQPSIFD